MDWQTILIFHLLGAILLGEGLIAHGKKTGKGTKASEYLMILFLWPILTIGFILVTILRRKGPK